MKTQKETDGALGGMLGSVAATETAPPLKGQISLMDILDNADDGTYGKPVEEFEV